MTCRIGITTDLIARRAHWESQYSGSFRNWQVLEEHYSKSAAQARETQLAKKHYGCEFNPGGEGPENATWHVYYFEHDGF